MSYKNTLSISILEELFEYNSSTGEIKRKSTGSVVSYSEFDEVAKVFFEYNGKSYRIAARIIAWAIYHKEWADDVIFHRDFNPFNLKITNLKQVSMRHLKALRTAYKNITQYCDVKPHPRDKYAYLIRYIQNGKLNYEKHHDLEFANRAANNKRNENIRIIKKLGGIPPIKP